MSKPPKADRPVPLKIYLPESVYGQLLIRLWSATEGRVPHGAWSHFFEELSRAALARMKG